MCAAVVGASLPTRWEPVVNAIAYYTLITMLRLYPNWNKLLWPMNDKYNMVLLHMVYFKMCNMFLSFCHHYYY